MRKVTKASYIYIYILCISHTYTFLSGGFGAEIVGFRTLYDFSILNSIQNLKFSFKRVNVEMAHHQSERGPVTSPLSTFMTLAFQSSYHEELYVFM